MPALGNNPSLSSPLAVAHGGSDLKSAPPRGSVEAPLPSSPKSLVGAPDCEAAREKNPHPHNGGAAPRRNGARTLEDYVGDWAERKMGSGEARSGCFLPFLVGAKRMAKCAICHRFIYPDEELQCAVRGCNGTYHLSCAKEKLGISNLKNFKCPQHACFICKQRPPHWRCVLCTIASHYKCAAWPEKVMHLKNPPGRAVCWRHLTNSRLLVGLADRITYLMNEQHTVSTSDIEEIFGHLPTPYDEEEFKFDITMKDMIENKMEPPLYVHIRRNIYLTRKKRDDVGDGIGCSSCSSMCSDNCVCRVQCISCSKACRCPENCNNRPFRKDKKIKIVKTELCGWGVEAAESINKGEFIVEYIGEVIDDALCEKRLWDMKFRGMKNFYMCEVRKDFTIDATFKGNASRFLNHSCDPNCFLEKWQVEGETRVGVFAARSIKVGEPLTYDYRFVQFGPEVECCCGSQNCQGYLGTKKKIAKLEVCWGSKRRRTTAACVAILTL